MSLLPRALMACLIVAGSLVLVSSHRAPLREQEGVPLNHRDMAKLARVGEGFLVWERCVDAVWQIWTMPLDGSQPESRLIPGEEGRQHFCPKISPDGTRVAYMSYARGESPTQPVEGMLWMLDRKSGKRTLLAERARSYQGDRAVSWLGEDLLCYINDEGHSVELDVGSLSRRTLTSTPRKKNGWLLNPQRTHATSGDAEFSPFDAVKGEVQTQPKQSGCQPYFSADGRWGFWMGGSGGPLNKMFLPTRRVEALLKANDPRLPKDRNYIYFPMLSSCQRLLAFAASADDHDHYDSDYDIFVIQVVAETLEPIGTAVRYTSFTGNDRYPDVFAGALPLSSHHVEAPARLRFSSPSGEACVWRVDGAEQGRGAVWEGEFTIEGIHWIEASSSDGGGVPARGYVHVRKPEAPSLELVRRVGDESLALTFDEAISLEQARAFLEDGTPVRLGGLEAQHHVATILLGKNLQPGTRLWLEGVTDRAQQAHAMPRTSITIPRRGWPQTTSGLVFAWEHRSTPALGLLGLAPVREGLAFWSSRGGMDTRGGEFELPEAGRAVLQRCETTGAFTFEAIITPMVPPYDREARPVFSLEDSTGAVRLAMLQRRSDWSLWLATEDNPRGTSIEQELLPLRTGQPHHVLFSYEKGQLRVYLNGMSMAVRPEVHGALKFAAADGVLRIGACSKLPARWHGMVDQLAVYNRALTPDEAVAHADHAAPKMELQRAARTRKVVARRIQTSRLPTLAGIAPYREALVQHLYEVLPKDRDDQTQDIPVGTRLAVNHWVWVNGQSAQPPALDGEVYRLFIQPSEAHLEIQPLVISSDLPAEASSEAWLEVSNW